MDYMIKHMQMFEAVAQFGSFTKAADQLRVPKATVSIGINKLEKQLNVRLLHRTTRKVQLTQDGILFLEKCRHILLELEEAKQLFSYSDQQLQGRIKIDVPSRIAATIILPNLGNFLTLYPDISIELGSTDRFVDLVEEGIDCVIRVGTLNDSSLVMKPIGKLPLISCASPEYLMQYGKLETLEDLANHRIVDYFSNNQSFNKPQFEYLDEQGNAQSVAMASTVSVNNAETYITAALNHLGIIQIPAYDVQQYLVKGQLEHVLPSINLQAMPINFLYPHRKHLSRRVQVFMQWAIQLMQAYIQ